MGPVLIMGANVCKERGWGDVIRFGPRSEENVGAAGVGLGRGGEGARHITVPDERLSALESGVGVKGTLELV